ncbi:MAG: hypothetical protein FJ390_07065 [Verrucomicrobia bacterium]|nr:hypothetical protein [Verrucomicrobiota bacterium]
MKKILLTCAALLSVMIFSSLLLADDVQSGINAPVLPIPQASDLTDDQLLEIGIKVWQNQCGIWDHPGKVTHDMKQGITSWESDYALIGIGQCIWYPADETKNFQEDWPRVAQDLKDKGYPIEDWMLGACPWNNSKEFFSDFNGDQLKSLRKMLAKKALITEQARCIATRLDESLDKITTAVDAETGITDDEKGVAKNLIIKNFYQVATDHYPRGLYALMDYVHFKGEGVLPTETINGVGWGLRQALEQMNPKTVAKKGAIVAFVDAAKAIYPDLDRAYGKERYNTYRTFNPDNVYQ